MGEQTREKEGERQAEREGERERESVCVYEREGRRERELSSCECILHVNRTIYVLLCFHFCV